MTAAPSEILRHAREHFRRKRRLRLGRDGPLPDMVTRYRDHRRGRRCIFPGGTAKQQFFDHARDRIRLARRGHFVGPPDRALVHCALACPDRRDACHRRSQSFAAFWRCDYCHLGPGQHREPLIIAALIRSTSARISKAIGFGVLGLFAAAVAGTAVASTWSNICVLLAIRQPERTDGHLAALDSI